MSIYRSDPAAPGANTGRRRAVPVLEERRFEAAIGRFNASAAAHTVAGLTRSLGQPRASLGAAAGSSSLVRVTVAWELCWYQWSVDLVSGRVAEIGKGEEVEQLDRSARHWNATAGKAGHLDLGAGGEQLRRRRWLRRR